jgi:hypothetical protein
MLPVGAGSCAIAPTGQARRSTSIDATRTVASRFKLVGRYLSIEVK